MSDRCGGLADCLEALGNRLRAGAALAKCFDGCPQLMNGVADELFRHVDTAVALQGAEAEVTRLREALGKVALALAALVMLVGWLAQYPADGMGD